MSTEKKLAITGIFLIGMMSVVASIIRMAIYLTVLYKGYGAGYDINRKLYVSMMSVRWLLIVNKIGTATTMLWWSMLEGSLAAIAACLPTLSFLFKDISIGRLYSRLLSSSGFSGSWRLSNNSFSRRKESNPSSERHADAIDSTDTQE